MLKPVRSALLTFLALAVAPAVSRAHRDTLTQVLEPDPLVAAYEAEALPLLGAAKPTDDAEATGGKSVVLAGEGAGFALDFGALPVGMHAVYVAAKVTEADAFVESYKREVQVGSPTLQSKPLYVALDVNSGPGGALERHLVRVPFSTQFEYVTKIYFHTPEARRYTGRLTIGPRSLIRELVVDRVELRNPLAALTFKAVKTKRILYTPADVTNLVQAAGKEGKLPVAPKAASLTAEERAARDEQLWNQTVMPLNGQTSLHDPGKEARSVALEAARVKLGRDPGQWTGPKKYDQPWRLVNTNLNLVYTMADYNAGKPLPAPWPFAEDKGGCFVEKDQLGNRLPFNIADVSRAMHTQYQLVTKTLGGPGEGLSWRYLLTGDLEAGSDGAFLLAAYAYRFPSYDWQVHNLDHSIPSTRTFEAGTVFGRGCSYEGWSTPEYVGLIRAYDMLFPYIKDNPELAARVGRFVPWVKTPADVVKLIDTFLVQRGAQDAIQQILYASALPVSAVVLGPDPVSDRLLDTYFRKLYFRDSLSGFLDNIVNGYSRDGLNYIGSSYYTVGESIGELMENVDLLKCYVQAGGAKKYDVSDPVQCPRLAAMPDAVLRLHVAGGFRPGVGDVMDPQMPPIYAFDPKEHGRFYGDAFRFSADPRYAWLLANLFGQGTLPDTEWAAVLKAAEGQRNPVRHGGSQVLEGFGFVSLEEGAESDDLRRKNAVMIQTGVGSGHAHGESLSYEVFARGLRMSGDLGGRASSMYGRPQVMFTRLHNLVEVDEKSHNGGSAENATGISCVNAWKTGPGAQFAGVSAKAESHPQVSVYERGLAQILCDPGAGSNGTPSAYVFDVFRAAGGKVHTWCFHGCVSEDFQCNAALQPAVSAVASNYLQRYYPGTRREGDAPEVLEATWKLRRTAETVDGFKFRNAEKNMLGALYDPESPAKFTRVSLFGRKGDRVLVANWSSKYEAGGRFYNFPFLHVRSEGPDGLAGVFPSIVETYAGQPFLTDKRLLAVEGAESGAAAPVAMAVRTAFGQSDLLFSGARTGRVYRIEGGARASGLFGFISRDQQGLRLAHLVGGTELDDGDIRIRTARHEYRAAVSAVNGQAVTLSESWPARLLDGEVLTLTNGGRRTYFQAGTIAGNQAVVKRTALAFQGGIESVNEAEGYANLDIIPMLYNYHPSFYDGMTAVTEGGRVLGKVNVRLGERFWYTGWPAVRRHQAVVRPEDVQDANGDGRRTLTMICASAVNRFAADGVTLETVKPGEPMLELEVTRVREDGLMFWTRQHPRPYLDSLKKPHAGWPYDQQRVVNEKGDKSWFVNMPGDVYQLWIDGKKLTDGDFDDPDRDGRRLVRFLDFGPGDQVAVPVHVYVRRLEPGRFEVRANAACELGLPAAGAPKGYACSADGVAWSPLDGRQEGSRWVFALAESQLAKPALIVKAAE